MSSRDFDRERITSKPGQRDQNAVPRDAVPRDAVPRDAVPRDAVLVGRIDGAYGIKGWVKVTSFTDPPENLLGYAPWQVGANVVNTENTGVHGNGWIVKFAGVDDRNAAQRLTGMDIVVPQSALPALAEGEYYWRDLLGLAVRDEQGRGLGRVETLLATGSNDVLVIKQGSREWLVPCSDETIRAVDFGAREMVVRWWSEDDFIGGEPS